MNHLRSFRVRLFLGSILWTLGLLFVAHMLSLLVIQHFNDQGLVFVYRKGHLELPESGSRAMTEEVLRTKVLDARRRTYVRGGVFSLLSMAGGLWLVWGGLRSLRQLHARLAEVRDGRETRVEGDYPSEVQPLVNDLNALLEHRQQQVIRAQSKAGDLAHGLKTPLALLAQEGERAGRAGQTELAASILEQVDRMQRQVDYHLANARAAASASVVGTITAVRPSVDGIVRTLQRLHAARPIEMIVDVDPEHAARVERQDLDEMLGNLIENAYRWAGGRIVITSSLASESLLIDVDDDGPGVDASLRETVLRRGARADESSAGSGLGLAIVRDLAELYGGSISLDEAPAGGLRARLTLPRR